MERILEYEKENWEKIKGTLSFFKKIWNRKLKQILKHKDYVLYKETLLLNWLKYSLWKKGVRDPFNDNELMKKQTALYFKCSNREITHDDSRIGEFCKIVKTNLFWGTYKHLSDRYLY
jgi:hypothetical protein